MEVPLLNACTSRQAPYISKSVSDKSITGALFDRSIDWAAKTSYDEKSTLATLVTLEMRLFDKFTNPETCASNARSNDVKLLFCKDTLSSFDSLLKKTVGI